MSRSALSIARTAKAAQSSSGEKQTAIAAPDVTEAAGSVGESVARESDRTRENTPKLWHIRLNSLLPCSGPHQIGMNRDRAAMTPRGFDGASSARSDSRPYMPLLLPPPPLPSPPLS